MTGSPAAICEVVVRLASRGSPADRDRSLIRFTELLQKISGVHSTSIAWARGEARITFAYYPLMVTAAFLSEETRRFAEQFELHQKGASN